ncbi:MAG TPA: DOMON-like domain-containing protein [Candidatus Binatia bacterium]|nr:DOMON-like domain-containing protein [Candidatus Binatia bacterium]
MTLSARATRAGTILALEFRLLDPTASIRLPIVAVDPARTDRLWEHTCFEAFVARDGEAAYWEANVSSAGHWNLWRFAGYRVGMSPELRIAAPTSFRTAIAGDAFVLSATFDLASIPELADDELAVGLAAVLETTSGRLSYWALRHVGAKPDFHARDGFDARLEVTP